MKRIIWMLMIMLLIGGMTELKAIETLKGIEQLAQTTVNKYLNDQGFQTSIDESDQSVNFIKDGLQYWITFKGDGRGGKGIFYTVNRSSVKLDKNEQVKNNPVKMNIVREKAIIAANELNRNYRYKTYVYENRVRFQFPEYAATPDAFLSQLENIIKALKDAESQFKAAFDGIGKQYTDSVHKFWATVDTARIVLTQPVMVGDKRTSGKFVVDNIKLESVNKKGEITVRYNEDLTPERTQFLRETLTLEIKSPGETVVGVKIFTPEGKMLAPSKDAEFTASDIVDLKKGGKTIDVTLPPFGTSNSEFWNAGTYNIEIYCGSEKVKSIPFFIVKSTNVKNDPAEDTLQPTTPQRRVDPNFPEKAAPASEI